MMVDVTEGSSSIVPESANEQSGVEDTGIRDVINDVINILPEGVWKFIHPQFYVTFWQLSQYDIFVPRERYKAEIAKQKAIAEQLSSERDPKKKKERDRIILMIQQVGK
jgi:THO complex subunit 2